MKDQGHVVLVPVKPPAVGKSRLVVPSPELRRELAVAFALDTVSACLATPGVGAVLAVTDDAAFSRRLAALGCEAVPDGVTGDLNACLRLGAAEAVRRWPQLSPVAVCADLPALRPADLESALDSLPVQAPAFVADAAGSGTTMYAAPRDAFDPRFGPGSRDAHLQAGAVAVKGGLESLRQDVDDLDDLRQVFRLGVGRHTSALEIAAGWVAGTGDPP
ncbi:MAG TPA: 2-phospho-L-lactate guanylyltransferase [Nocardioides sp.]|nr:2-phospho-L-lactate guanylyltransferase [Nocardioides sp.]